MIPTAKVPIAMKPMIIGGDVPEAKKSGAPSGALALGLPVAVGTEPLELVLPSAIELGCAQR